MANIFITGGLGFIGSALTKRLIGCGHSVTIYDNFSNGKESFLEASRDSTALSIIRGDLLDLSALTDAINGAECVFHLSANADIALSAQDTSLDLKQTVIATYNVLEAMRIRQIRKLIYSSGSGVYGDLGAYAPREDHGPLRPVSMYGATKLGAEALISAFASLFDMKTAIFRFANVIGPNQTHGVAFDFINKLKDTPGRLEVLGDGMQSKSYIHVEDVIAAMTLIMDNLKTTVETFNASSGDYITVKEIAELVVAEAGEGDVEIVYGETSGGWAGDIPVVRLDDSKLRSNGWKSTYSSREAMVSSIKSMTS